MSFSSEKKFGFSKKFRIREGTTYRGLFCAKRKIRTDFFVLSFKESQVSYPRLGLVASKKKFPEQWIGTD